MGWIVFSKKICWSSSPWYLWMWPYLEIMFLQMWLGCKLSSYWSRVDSIQYDSCPYKERKKVSQTHREEYTIWSHRHTEGTWPCNDGGRDWSDAATGKEMPRISNNHRKLGESSSFCRQPWFQNSDLQNCWRINFWFFKLSKIIVICYSSPRKLIQADIT